MEQIGLSTMEYLTKVDVSNLPDILVLGLIGLAVVVWVAKILDGIN